MTDYKEILRILAQGLSQRNTALACGVPGTRLQMWPGDVRSTV